MKYFSIFSFSVLLFMFPVSAFSENWNPLPEYPHVVLTNENIEMSVFLPDKEKGFYRGSRFDWSGMVWQLTCNGHTYFVPRHMPHDPANSGHGMSFAEEFSIGTNKHIPQRYPEAKPEETFMKIGVGLLRKPADDPRYHFATNYEIADAGSWTIDHGDTWVTFAHILNDAYGFGYEYTKHMELLEGTQNLIIHCTLKNTGTRPILEDQYNHNFFGIDSDPIGPQYTVKFAFSPVVDPKRKPPADTALLKDNTLSYLKPVEKSFLLIFDGYSSSPNDGAVTIENTRTGAGVEISGDFPLYGFNFWTSQHTLCAELFAKIDIQPGETIEWQRTYRFITK